MNGSVPSQPSPRRIGECAIGKVEEFPRFHLLVRTHAFPEPAAVANQRPIFEDFGVAADALEPSSAADQAEQAELQREAGLDRFLRRRLAGLVVDDREPAVGKAVDPVDPAVHE